MKIHKCNSCERMVVKGKFDILYDKSAKVLYINFMQPPLAATQTKHITPSILLRKNGELIIGITKLY